MQHQLSQVFAADGQALESISADELLTTTSILAGIGVWVEELISSRLLMGV